MPEKEPLTIFISYNSADEDFATKLAAALSIAGARVWYAAWNIRPGDSIVGEVDKGLAVFDLFVLVWSNNASRSRWVKTEMEAAVAQWIGNPSKRIVPIMLEETPLPQILRSIRYINCVDGDWIRVARELLGIETESAFRLAVQNFINEAGLDFREYWGYGVLVACPRCGASPENLEGWSATDYERDDQYAGVRCKVCG